MSDMFDDYYQSPELMQLNEEEEARVMAVPEHKNRYVICQTCDTFYSRLKVCKECFCFMPAKVRLANASCPKGHW